MIKTLTIDGKELEFAANAATPFRYKQIFHRDLFQILANEEKAETEGVEAVTQLAYVMVRNAEGADMNKLNEDDFITWLEGFSGMAFINAAEDILSVYMDSTHGSATP